jgi:hypothetical protein
MMLGHPKAPVAERFGVTGKVERVSQRLSGIAAFSDGSEIQD